MPLSMVSREFQKVDRLVVSQSMSYLSWGRRMKKFKSWKLKVGANLSMGWEERAVSG